VEEQLRKGACDSSRGRRESQEALDSKTFSPVHHVKLSYFGVAFSEHQ
jgi:hypothetical protein